MKFFMVHALCMFAGFINASDLMPVDHYIFNDNRSFQELNELHQLLAERLHENRKTEKRSNPRQGAPVKVAVKRQLFDV